MTSCVCQRWGCLRVCTTSARTYLRLWEAQKPRGYAHCGTACGCLADPSGVAVQPNGEVRISLSLATTSCLRLSRKMYFGWLRSAFPCVANVNVQEYGSCEFGASLRHAEWVQSHQLYLHNLDSAGDMINNEIRRLVSDGW